MLPNFIKELDMFGAAVPNINLGGLRQVKTSCGATASIFVLMLTVAFTLLKIERLILNKNP